MKLKLYHQKLDKNFKLSGKPEVLTPESLTVSVPYQAHSIWSSDSQKLLLLTSNAKWKDLPYSILNLIDLKTKRMEKLTEGRYQPNALSLSPDGEKLLTLKLPCKGEQRTGVIPAPEGKSPTIEIMNLNTKETVSFSDPDILSIVGWTGDTKGVVLTKQEGTKEKLYVLDIQTQKLMPKGFLDMTVVRNVILSKNQKYMGFIAENLYQPGEVYITLLDNFSPQKVTAVNKPINLSAIRAHSLRWKSFDGIEIEGILIYPQNYKKGQKAPLIVSVHGGPTAAESENFLGSAWRDKFSPAVLASLGYAILVVNFRGSTGYGEKFQHLNYQDIGGGDFKDIMSGVDYLISQGIADPDKLFISGTSYGGFMTAWAIGQTDRFKAAAMSAGIVNWISDIANTDYPTSMEAILGGYYWDNEDLWRKLSPLTYIANVKTPVLILQGRADARVEISQAQQFYRALRGRKIPNRLVSYQSEKHSFSDAEAIKDAMNETIEWFGRYGG